MRSDSQRNEPSSSQRGGSGRLTQVGLSSRIQVVTLPVEFDASNRAKELVLSYGIVSQNERQGMDRVLNAAALTYVAAAISSLLTLLYFLFRAGLLGGRRDD